MYRNQKISLVIPAYNEEKLIRPTLEGVPEIFDRVYVVDDASPDRQAEVVREIAEKDPRIELIQHERNLGVGQGIITGYLKSYEDGYDIAVVCGGDAQMPLEETPAFLDPILDDGVDYCKGNRFMNRGNAFDIMPATRFWGNTLLSLMTKVASGNYDVFDVVDGFVAISRRGIERVDWAKAWKGYGYPMDFVIRISAAGLVIKDVPRTAIYLPGERQSQIKGFRYMIKVTPMIFKAFVQRMVQRYIFADFHPLVLLYLLGGVCTGLGLLSALVLGFDKLFLGGVGVTGPRSSLTALLLISGSIGVIGAMAMDIQNFQHQKLMRRLESIEKKNKAKD
jgi:glycosyltransferase involved in cell wall biosynthesis